MQALTFQSILVASDLEPSTDAAIAGAAALASELGAELHVLHATNLPTADYAATASAVDIQSQVHAERRRLRDQIERALPTGSVVTSQQVRFDSALRAIQARAKEVGADLIVLGPHRPRMFRGPILGNTADRVLRSAEVPVLILAERIALPLRRIVIPVDLSDPARGALDHGLVWARELGNRAASGDVDDVQVRVFHVIPRVFEAYDFPFDRAVIAPQLNREIDEAVARVGNGFGGNVREEIVWGNAPAEEICRYVEREGTDLLVMGTHGYGALGRALIGSITSVVARTAPCPMLLVPPSMWEVTEPAANIPIEVEMSEPVAPVQ